MKKLSNKIQAININHIFGLSLFELTLTITISSIIFTIAIMFVTATVNLTRQISLIDQSDNSTKVILNLLTEDFLNNNGNVQIVKDNLINTLTLSFNIPNPNNEATDMEVAYIYDLTYHQLYKKISNEPSKLLLDNLNDCSFTTNIANNMTNITLSIKLIIQQANNPYTIYEVINAPYTQII